MGHGLPDAVRGQALADDALGRLVGAEEECGAGRGSDERAADAAVDAGEAAGREEAGRGLETCLEGVEWEEGEVDCRAGEGACEEGGLEGGVLGRHCSVLRVRDGGGEW